MRKSVISDHREEILTFDHWQAPSRLRRVTALMPSLAGPEGPGMARRMTCLAGPEGLAGRAMTSPVGPVGPSIGEQWPFIVASPAGPVTSLGEQAIRPGSQCPTCQAMFAMPECV